MILLCRVVKIRPFAYGEQIYLVKILLKSKTIIKEKFINYQVKKSNRSQVVNLFYCLVLLPGMRSEKINDIRAIAAHKKLHGKISIVSKIKLTRKSLGIYYTPGVGAVSSYLAKHKNKTAELTIKSNSVAIISDGSAVLGLGNIGPEAALPVMEGKALLFKALAGIDAFPIVLSTQNPLEIIKTVQAIAPTFGGINLEDIAAPQCFEIEKILQRTLDIPVVHDDQHGIAVTTLAALKNALKVAKKSPLKSRIVIIGAGAAGTGITKLLHAAGMQDLIVLDSAGIIDKSRKKLNSHKKELAQITNRKNIKGGLNEAALNADVLIGVATAGIIKSHHIKNMAAKPIVFALGNPIPEIMPRDAKKTGAFIVATGRSDFENQINNALVFPGLFRGALNNSVRRITFAMKLRAAANLASLIKNPTQKNIIPSIFDKRVVSAVSMAIK